MCWNVSAYTGLNSPVLMSCANTFTQFPPFCHDPVSGIFSPAVMHALSLSIIILDFLVFSSDSRKYLAPHLLFIGTNLYISLLYPYQNRPTIPGTHPRNPLFFQSFQCFHMRMSIAVSFTAGDHCQFWRNLF